MENRYILQLTVNKEPYIILLTTEVDIITPNNHISTHLCLYVTTKRRKNNNKNQNKQKRRGGGGGGGVNIAYSKSSYCRSRHDYVNNHIYIYT